MGELPTAEQSQAAMLDGFRGQRDQSPLGADGHPMVPCPAGCGSWITATSAAAYGGRPGPVERVTESTAPAVEASIAGKRSFDDIREIVRAALRARLAADPSTTYSWAWISDLTDTDVVYGVDDARLWQCSYSLDSAGKVTLGEPVAVVRTYAPAAAGSATEATSVDGLIEDRATVPGRVLEAKGTAADGGRIFRSRIIAYGDSANGRRYPETVMRAAAPLYEGAKAYDRHRDAAELRAGTIAGLVGYYRNVEATEDGLEADLYLLPSATHAAEALDASLALAAEGMTPLIGVSHDVMATFRPIQDGGRRLQEATAIVRVMSADLVSDPAAGGKPVRAVAGGTDPTTPAPETKTETRMDWKKLREALGLPETATEADTYAALGKRLQEGTAPPAPGQQPASAPARESAGEPKGSFLVGMMVREKVAAAKLPAKAVEAVTAALPDRVAEADVDAQIAAIKTAMGVLDIPDPTGTVQVGQESHEKKVKALDAMFDRNYREGYRSFRQAFVDITGKAPRSWDEDFARTILKESIGTWQFSSAGRAEESLTTASWDQVLGDSITRRMIAEYARPSLQTWRKIVSDITSITDFRTLRRPRLGGYGVLPLVNQGAPYQPLTSPPDEEATYALAKRGGTEDLTLEMIANDDLGQITAIPRKLGLAAAQTLFRYVWDILPANAVTTYDATALFHATHGNTTATVPLSQTNLSVLRRKMRQQTAYGDAFDVLSIVPKTLVVPSALEEIAFQLATSAVAIPATAAGASNTPNLHQGLDVAVVDYYSDADDWYLAADPTMVPTIEIGFYLGREDPELFTQADPTVGSMFDADKLTYKIRHIYNGVVLDHRGFQRATN